MLERPESLPHDPWSNAPLRKPRDFPLCQRWMEHIQEHVIPLLLRPATEQNRDIHRIFPLMALHGMQVEGVQGPSMAVIRDIEERTAAGMAASDPSPPSMEDDSDRPQSGPNYTNTMQPQRGGCGGRTPTDYLRALPGSLPIPEVLNTGILYKYVSPEDRQQAIYRTLQYLYFHMRKGILVQVQQGKVRLFVPFVNCDNGACNLWKERGERAFTIEGVALHEEETKVRGAVKHYFDRKFREWGDTARRYDEHYDPNPAHWWANAGVIDNVPQEDAWSDRWNHELKSMLDAVADRYHLFDCTFFLNKRDYPQFRYDGRRVLEPYPFLFRRGAEPPNLVTHAGMDYEESSSFAPVFSFASSDQFADVLMPTVDDWLQANGRGSLSPSAILPRWDERANKAVFRGSATGMGVDGETNARLALVALATEHDALMDVALTGWNLRDRVVPGKTKDDPPRLAYIPKGLKGRVDRRYRMSYEEQAAFKYLIYVDGHSAAYRYGPMMQLGCCVLRVSATVDASELWFFGKLQGLSVVGVGTRSEAEWERLVAVSDHVIVPQVADLPDVITWCREHDSWCAQMARNAMQFAMRWLSRESILAYWANCLHAVHANQYRLLTHQVPLVMRHEETAEVSEEL